MYLDRMSYGARRDALWRVGVLGGGGGGLGLGVREEGAWVGG
jgi:hypothetical protein